MVVGVPKEIKKDEYRVAIVPVGVKELRASGPKVIIQSGSGSGSGISDGEYLRAGAKILPGAAEVWKRSDLIIKVKEPLEEEYQYLREGLIVMTFFHFAANAKLTKELLKSGIVAIAYETI